MDGLTHVNKYGRAPDGVQTTATDIYDRADAAATQQIWLKPAAATTHNIKSTSVFDASPAGTGAQTVKIFGLPDWDSKQISETIALDGTNDVETVNSYVIIHRMFVATFGSTSVNAGTITATATTGPGVVTAQINIGQGQTQMAIYGIPSVQTAFMTNWYASIYKAPSGTHGVNFSLLYGIDTTPTLQQYTIKETRGLQTNGTSNAVWWKQPYKKFEGPGILKVQATGTSADIDASAGFDLILLDN